MDLAEKVGQSDKMAVSKWERGVTVPGAGNLDALADALRVSVDYLLGRTDDPRGVVNESDLTPRELDLLVLAAQERATNAYSALAAIEAVQSVFWELPDAEINQYLLWLLGDMRIAIASADADWMLVPKPPRQSRK